MTLTVHHLNNSRSQRLLWLLEELDLDYEIIRHERDKKTMRAPAALRAIHPLGKSPVLVHDGKTLAETGNIVEYVIETFGKVTLAPPSGSDDERTARYFIHYAEGSFMPPLLVKLIMGEITSPKVPFLVRPIAKAIAKQVNATFTHPEIKTHLTFLNDALVGKEWFAGQLTGADIMLSFPLEAARERTSLDAYPNLEAFLKRVHARPAYQRALEKGGAYAYA